MSGRCGITVVLAVMLGLVLQSLIVLYRFDGNWSGFFCTGSFFPVPPALSSEQLYIWAGTPGYDGQMYHYLAHDPFLQSDIQRYMDSPQARSRRILVSLLAWMLAMGRSQQIDIAIVIVNVCFLGLGTWWLARYLVLADLPPVLALSFLAVPGVLISLERFTVDLAFTALAIGFVLHVRLGSKAPAWTILMLMCLTRETGLLFVGGACVAAFFARRFLEAALWATAAAPCTVWYSFVSSRTPPHTINAAESLMPLTGLAAAFTAPLPYPSSESLSLVLTSSDRLVLVGFVLSVALTARLVWQNGLKIPELTMIFLCLTGLCLPRSYWIDCLAVARVFSILMISVALLGWPLLRWLSLAPLVMVLPRVALEIGVPLLGAILRH